MFRFVTRTGLSSACAGQGLLSSARSPPLNRRGRAAGWRGPGRAGDPGSPKGDSVPESVLLGDGEREALGRLAILGLGLPPGGMLSDCLCIACFLLLPFFCHKSLTELDFS